MSDAVFASPDRPRERRWRSRLRRVLPWLAGSYLLAAFVATHMPMPRGGAEGIPHFDKIVHVAIFFGLSLLTAAWRTTRFAPPRRAAAVTAILCMLYGVGDELTQTLTADRTADPWDLVADGVGTGLGLAVFFPLLRWWRRHA